MHEPGHCKTCEDTLDGRVNLLQVVVLDGGGDQLGFGFTGHLVWRIQVLQRSQVILLDDDEPDIKVDQEGQGLADNEGQSDVEKSGWIFEIQLLGHLHADKHQDEVGDCRVHRIVAYRIGS